MSVSVEWRLREARRVLMASVEIGKAKLRRSVRDGERSELRIRHSWMNLLCVLWYVIIPIWISSHGMVVHHVFSGHI